MSTAETIQAATVRAKNAVVGLLVGSLGVVLVTTLWVANRNPTTTTVQKVPDLPAALAALKPIGEGPLADIAAEIDAGGATATCTGYLPDRLVLVCEIAPKP